MTGGMMAALLAASSLVPVAQQAPPAPAAAPAQAAPEIVVTAPDLPAAETVRRMAKAISPRTGWNEPLARFADPVCIGVAGLPPAMGARVADRMLEVAHVAGLRVLDAPCAPNVLVLFVDDGATELERVAKRRPELFDAHPRDLRRIAAEPGPARVVTTSALRTRDGEPAEADPLSGAVTLQVATSSTMALPVRRDMLRSVLVVDRAAMIGRTPVQVADYAAMRTLAMVRPRGASGGDTILTLFDADAPAPPPEMTPFDRAYLKALYTGAGNDRGGAKVATIARRVAEEVATPKR